MDNVRLFLFLGLAFTGMLIWQAWQQDYGRPQVVQQPPTVGVEVTPSTQGADTPTPPAVPEMTSDDVAALPNEATAAQARWIEVVTDTLRLQIDTRGATIVSAELQEYPLSIDQRDKNFTLLSTDQDFFIAQSGLLSGETERAPTHQAVYASAQNRYDLAPGEDRLVVDFSWTGPSGEQVIKRYRFTRGTHLVELEHIVTNGGSEPWSGGEYRQLQRTEPQGNGTGSAFMYTYTGGVIYSPDEKYQKYSFEDLASGKLNREVTGGWIAMIEHYFLAALVPPPATAVQFEGQQVGGGRYLIRYKSKGVTVAPGESHTFAGSLWLGPKSQSELAEIAPGLDLTVDYGWLTVLAQPMWWVLEWIHDIVKNWGWTIIIFTVLIKLVFFKLSETSYRSMANMRKLAPRMQALKDRYGDDKQRMQQAMMEMYKKEKINPLGGCLPMLIQIPFFIALYWVLLESVELRQAPWILWINDLSVKDPYFVLPVLMGATMVVQQKLNPAPPDPMQAKIMMALPFVFTAMFAFFPSGLVLYWFTNNLLSIAQQWVITRRIEQGAKA